MNRFAFRTSLVVAALALPMAAVAQNDTCANCSFRVPNATLISGVADQELSVEVTNVGKTLYGLSFALRTDAAKLEIIEVARQGTVIAGADFFDGGIDVAGGKLGFGVLFDVGGDFSSKFLPPGENQVLAKVKVNVKRVGNTNAQMVFEDVSIAAVSNQPITNVMTNTQGFSIIPQLLPGTITIQDRTPVIASVSNNQGPPGQVFQVVGDFFTEPGLAVTVDGVAATAVLRADNRTLDVTAPPSAKNTCVPVVVSTARGSDTEAQGYCYQVTGEGVGPFIRGDANGDGTVNIADASFALNFLFLGGPDLPCAAAGDANGDGTVNIADASFALNFLFLGGPDPRAPHPDCGLSTDARDVSQGCVDPKGCQ
jgi:hypothetical protein